jgi:hypothetical protein
MCHSSIRPFFTQTGRRDRDYCRRCDAVRVRLTLAWVTTVGDGKDAFVVLVVTVTPKGISKKALRGENRVSRGQRGAEGRNKGKRKSWTRMVTKRWHLPSRVQMTDVKGLNGCLRASRSGLFVFW